MKTKTNNNFAVGYCRYSSDNQREESIEAQKRAIQKYADENNIIISKWYVDEAKSGTNAEKRDQFMQMIADSKDGTFNMVIVHKLDRFSRSKYDSVMYKHRLSVNGVKLFSVTERIDVSTPEGLIMESMLEAMAQYYSDNLGRETMKGLKENAYKGMCCGGVPPYGYKRIPKIVNGEEVYNKKGLPLHDTVLDPEKAEAVKIMFNMTLQGKKRIEIIEKLNELGFTDGKGQPFKHTTSIDNILRNERYTGVYVFNKYRRKRTLNGYSKVLNDDEDIIKIDGGLPQIISKEMFDGVQKILELRVHKTPSNTKENYLLSGKVICGVCGQHYQGWKKETKTKKHLYYKCIGNGRYRHSKLKENYCNNTGVRKDDLEDYVVEQVVNLLKSPEVVDQMLESYKKFINDYHGNQTLIDNLNKKVAQIDSQIQNVINAIAQGQYSDLFYDKLKELEKEKAQVKLNIDKELLQKGKLDIDKDKVVEAYYKSLEILKNKKSSFEKRKTIINAFVNKIVIYTNEVEIYLNGIPANLCGNFSLDIKPQIIGKQGANEEFQGNTDENIDNEQSGYSLINIKEKVAGKVTCNSTFGSPGRI